MMVEHDVIKHLSIDFDRDVKKDEAKRRIRPAKLLLQGLCSWPDTNKPSIVFVNWFNLINQMVIEIFHISYVLLHLDDVIDCVTTFTTVTTTFEALVRVYSLIVRKQLINDILYKIWKEFWPFDIIDEADKPKLKFKLSASVALPGTFLFFSVISNSVIAGVPYVRHHALIMNSAYPFAWNQSFVFEVIYVWQYYSDWFALFIVNGFDFLFMPLVMICAIQFSVMEEVFRQILTEGSKRHRQLIFGDKWRHITDKDMLGHCLTHHRMLLDICTKLENSFNMVILIQYVTSTTSICSGILTLKLDSSQGFEMCTYFAAHFMQLFYYCYVGQELVFQSTNLSDAIYECNWHLGYNRDFRKTLVLMIQRSHREQCLTAAGVTKLDYAGYIKVMRISFSFYTLFDSLVEKDD